MDKRHILGKLDQLRREIERETGGLTEQQTCLLTDVCQVLGLTQVETHDVVGETFQTFINQPAPYRLTEQAQAQIIGPALQPAGRQTLV